MFLQNIALISTRIIAPVAVVVAVVLALSSSTRAFYVVENGILYFKESNILDSYFLSKRL